MPLQTLPGEHLEQYKREGYLLVSGLIPEHVSEKAVAAMWQLMRMDAKDRQTWRRIPEEVEYNANRGLVAHYGVQHPDLLACATPEFMQATAQLIGEDVDSLHPPEAVQTQNLFPVDREWTISRPHVDGIPKENKHKTFPGPYRIASLIYFNDIEPCGGGTAVWPKSHRKIRELAESDVEKYRYLYDLNTDIKRLDLGEPIELTPKRGDVLFFQYLFGHNGTPNVNVHPRLALRFFCSCRACLRWKKTQDWNFWTP